jgi:uncharacterized membrane protein
MSSKNKGEIAMYFVDQKLTVMNSVSSRPLSYYLSRISITVLIPATIYFLFVHAFPKFIYSEGTYGEYYWPRAPWLLTHVIFGVIAILTGPFQFVEPFRNKYLKLHRMLGKLYLASTMLAAASAIYLAVTSAIAQWYEYGLIVGALIWIYTGSIAYIHIKNLRTELHRKMMIRNYVITFFFIIFFAIYDLFVYTGTDPYDSTMLSVLPWACLLIPLGVTEYIIRKR